MMTIGILITMYKLIYQYKLKFTFRNVCLIELLLKFVSAENNLQ